MVMTINDDGDDAGDTNDIDVTMMTMNNGDDGDNGDLNDWQGDDAPRPVFLATKKKRGRRPEAATLHLPENPPEMRFNEGLKIISKMLWQRQGNAPQQSIASKAGSPTRPFISSP